MILLWSRSDSDGKPGWLAVWWDQARSAPYDCKWGNTKQEAISRLT